MKISIRDVEPDARWAIPPGSRYYALECQHGIGICMYRLAGDHRTDRELLLALCAAWRADGSIAPDDVCVREVEARYLDAAPAGTQEA